MMLEQPPKDIVLRKGLKGFLIRDDYITVLERLFEAAGFESFDIHILELDNDHNKYGDLASWDK